MSAQAVARLLGEIDAIGRRRRIRWESWLSVRETLSPQEERACVHPGLPSRVRAVMAMLDTACERDIPEVLALLRSTWLAELGVKE